MLSQLWLRPLQAVMRMWIWFEMLLMSKVIVVEMGESLSQSTTLLFDPLAIYGMPSLCQRQ